MEKVRNLTTYQEPSSRGRPTQCGRTLLGSDEKHHSLFGSIQQYMNQVWEDLRFMGSAHEAFSPTLQSDAQSRWTQKAVLNS